MFGNALTFFTIYTIFFDDLKRWHCAKWADYPNDAITICAFWGFAIEFVCKVDLGKCVYCKSLPCFLDFASTASLIMDLSLITEDVMAGGKSGGPKFSRAGRASRVGTKVGRLVKIVRLLKIGKILELCKNDALERERARKKEEKQRNTIKQIYDARKTAPNGSITGDIGNNPETNHTITIEPGFLGQSMTKEKNDGIAAWFSLGHTIDLTPKKVEDEDDMQLPAESKIGTKLTNVSQKKIILIVLLLMMSTPMFAASYYYTEVPSLIFDAVQWGEVVQQVSAYGSSYNDVFNDNTADYIRKQYLSKTMPVLNMTAKYQNEPSNEYIYLWTAHPDEYEGLRMSEKSIGLGSIEANAQNNTRHVEVYLEVNVREGLVYSAYMGIIKTQTVCQLLTIASGSFMNDFGAFLQLPIEKLTDYVFTVMKNPLSLYGEFIMNQGNPKTQIRADIIEYFYIQMALMQIAAYLGAAHGGKSVETICKPLILFKRDINQTGVKKSNAIIVIVGIRNMTQTIDFLQENSIIYINRIFDTFGKTTDRYDGLINSTSDLKYLLIWKLAHDPDSKLITKKMDDDMHSEAATKALVACAKALSKLYRQTELMEMADKITGKIIDSFISQNSDMLTRNGHLNGEKGVMVTDGNESSFNYNSNPNLARTGETEFTHTTKAQNKGKRGSKNQVMPIEIDSQQDIKKPSGKVGNFSKGNVIMNDGMVVNPFKCKNNTIDISLENLSKDSPQKTSPVDKDQLNLPKRKLVTWAINKGQTQENILGSIYKCNPVYNGPEIEILNKIQKLNEIYDTSCIITHLVYQHLPESIGAFFRKIDRVIISKESDILTLYSIDWFPENQQPFETDDLSNTETKKKKQMVISQLIQSQIFKGERNSLFLDEQDIQVPMATDHDFQFAFRSAIDYYLVGAWDDSLQQLRTCLTYRPRDGPSLEIFKYINEAGHMANGQCHPPKDWKGFRNITHQIKDIVE